jgi:alpha-L-arabinofuranosidase
MIPGNNKMKKIVKKINGIKIDVRSEKSLYITIKDWTIYIDNSTNEKIIDVWNEKKDITVQELH